jgi:hypothetical protein
LRLSQTTYATICNLRGTSPRRWGTAEAADEAALLLSMPHSEAVDGAHSPGSFLITNVRDEPVLMAASDDEAEGGFESVG